MRSKKKKSMKKYLISGRDFQVRVIKSQKEPKLLKGEKLLGSVDPCDWDPFSHIESNDPSLILLAKMMMQANESGHQNGCRASAEMEAFLP
jgi:hypothetical protein